MEAKEGSGENVEWQARIRRGCMVEGKFSGGAPWRERRRGREGKEAKGIVGKEEDAGDEGGDETDSGFAIWSDL